jgi:hypothetical protein
MAGRRLKWRVEGNNRRKAQKFKSLRRLGKNDGNVDFIKKTDYNKKKE